MTEPSAIRTIGWKVGWNARSRMMRSISARASVGESAPPDRWDGALPTLSLLDCRRLEFEPPDHGRFPCLRLAYRALEAGDAYPVVLNAANEVAVASFLEGAVPFPAIARSIDAALEAAARQGVQQPGTLAAIRELDAWARTYTGSRLQSASAS